MLCTLLLLLITLMLTVLFNLFGTYMLLDLLEEALCTLSLLFNYTYFYNYLKSTFGLLEVTFKIFERRLEKK